MKHLCSMFSGVGRVFLWVRSVFVVCLLGGGLVSLGAASFIWAHGSADKAALEIALPPLSADELKKLKPPHADGPLPIGVHRDLPGNIEADTRAWQKTSLGWVWRVRIVSPGAATLRVFFQDFNVGKGQVWLYGRDGRVDGPYTRRGMYDDGQFWSGPVFDDHITIEYRPAMVQVTLPAPFRMSKLSHSLLPRLKQ